MKNLAHTKEPTQASAWALIPAGGEGMRLRPLTRRIVGDERPKQFCPLLDGETLLDRTRRRVDLLVRPDRQVVVVSRPHERYYRAPERELLPGRLAIQPSNRGTAAGYGTDAFIPYDMLGADLGALPARRDAKVVLYCRSGRMSTIAAPALVRLGYTNVWNLDGGMIAWENAGAAIEHRPR